MTETHHKHIRVAVIADGLEPDARARAEALAGKLRLPLVLDELSLDEQPEFLLAVTPDRVELRETRSRVGAICVDFVHGPLAFRRRSDLSRRQPIASAVGHRRGPVHVVDAEGSWEIRAITSSGAAISSKSKNIILTLSSVPFSIGFCMKAPSLGSPVSAAKSRWANPKGFASDVAIASYSPRAPASKSDYIRDAMDQSRSQRQVVILDCCNSGAFAQGTKAATGVSIGTATAFEAGYGRVILTASDSTQFAWEGDKIIGETDNSLFTHFLVKGLQGEADLDSDGCITVDEMLIGARRRGFGSRSRSSPKPVALRRLTLP